MLRRGAMTAECAGCAAGLGGKTAGEIGGTLEPQLARDILDRQFGVAQQRAGLKVDPVAQQG